ncbi:hypothetical protein AEST_08830 [Alishewanella aestuarii B11]|uniref:Uncharacterized protein n=1 Tax=Alishewanella aestuarii B11 TaxID=1197174 RepID=J1Q529_9ALTE|nr:hypothetical protein AEST_08830 [Alishewanella aestuarii B11]
MFAEFLCSSTKMAGKAWLKIAKSRVNPALNLCFGNEKALRR